MQHYIVKESSCLLDALTKLAPESSKTTLRSWIKQGRVSIDGKSATRGDTPVENGQKIVVGAKELLLEDQLRIIYQDSHFIVVDKPANMLSVETAFDKTSTAHAILKRHLRPNKVYVVHRLDQETSGVMLFGLSEKGYQGLKTLFGEHEINRCYYAVVEGVVPKKKGTWQSYLYEDKRYFVHTTDDPEKGELAITNFEVVKSSPKYTLLKLNLETGRKNQIRVHCSTAGNPIAGDEKYGAVTYTSRRLCLHAAQLEFIHPVTNKQMRFSSPVPESFERLLGNKLHA